MSEIREGDKIKAIFTQPLPGNDISPEIRAGDIYECLDVFYDKKGNQHIDIGIVRTCNYVTSYATGEVLPGKVHWCHPNRFVKI